VATATPGSKRAATKHRQTSRKRLNQGAEGPKRGHCSVPTRVYTASVVTSSSPQASPAVPIAPDGRRPGPGWGSEAGLELQRRNRSIAGVTDDDRRRLRACFGA
jgi:hypothetical protein